MICVRESGTSDLAVLSTYSRVSNTIEARTEDWLLPINLKGITKSHLLSLPTTILSLCMTSKHTLSNSLSALPLMRITVSEPQQRRGGISLLCELGCWESKIESPVGL
jgi:hypothetical protein